MAIMSNPFLFLREYLLRFGLLTPECFQELLVKFNFGHTSCLKTSLSKGLGVGIIAGSALVKLPQIFKILGSGSAEGLSFFGIMLELFAITASGAYSYTLGYPFSTYGEAVFLSLQTSIIAFFVLFYGKRMFGSLLFTVLYGMAIYCIVTPGVIPTKMLWYGQAANIPMVVVGKMIQIITNYRNGHTGQLSAITVFMLALGAVARIFTSVEETGDIVVIMTYVASSVVNWMLALQVLYYWNAPTTDLEKKKSKVEDQQRKRNKPKKA